MQLSSCCGAQLALIATFLILVIAPANLRGEKPPVSDELTRQFQPPNHYLVENEHVANELGPTPSPFLDWGLIQPGHIDYVDRESGEILPLNEPHDVAEAKRIEARPFCIPSGIEIEVQPAQAGGAFDEVLFAPEFPWEDRCEVHTLIYDEAAALYRLWYRTKRWIAYAESADFRNWRRPLHSYVAAEGHAETNLVGVVNRAELAASDLRSPEAAQPGRSGAFFVDPSAPPDERFRCTFLAHVRDDDTAAYAQRTSRPISAMTGPGSTVIFGAVSADGLGWRVLPRPILLHDADTMTVARFDPVLQKLVMYTRLYELSRRSIACTETVDFSQWPLPVNALSAGPADRPTLDYYTNAATHYPGHPRLRLLFCNVYDRASDRSSVHLAVSQDGRAFHFPSGGPVIAPGGAASPSAEFLQPFPSFVRAPDGSLLLFFNEHYQPHKFPRHRFASSSSRVAMWSADRMSAIVAREQGEFTTAAFKLRGDELILNFACPRAGRVSVEVRDEQFRIVAGHSFADCDPLHGDRQATVMWQGQRDLSHLRDQTIYLRFQLLSAKLYSVAAVESEL